MHIIYTDIIAHVSSLGNQQSQLLSTPTALRAMITPVLPLRQAHEGARYSDQLQTLHF